MPSEAKIERLRLEGNRKWTYYVPTDRASALLRKLEE